MRHAIQSVHLHHAMHQRAILTLAILIVIVKQPFVAQEPPAWQQMAEIQPHVYQPVEQQMRHAPLVVPMYAQQIDLPIHLLAEM